ncbi:MAG: carboxylesterase family protein [Alphaproteobacteria bacterium]
MSGNRNSLSRRGAMMLTAGGAALATTAHAADGTKTGAHQDPGNCTTPRSAIANTQYGKVRGYLDGGVFTFKGIPYGQDTGGANRWLPAKPPTPWDGERNTLIYGANCPQTLHDFKAVETSFLFDWDDGYQSEDMLKLNIWTSSLSGKKPVMVYFHGGGFSFGSAYELPSHEGAQMARHHDVVQVSVNHRLNALGFLDLSEIGGPAYAESANVGMTDLVAALRWVRDNIANFGGDPNRVMIYGQSGGGSKVTCLMGMPSARGLFHTACVQSGGGGNFADAEQSRALARQLMVELGLGPKDIAGLQQVEWSKLWAAGQAAVTKVNGPLPPGAFFPPSSVRRAGWAPPPWTAMSCRCAPFMMRRPNFPGHSPDHRFGERGRIRISLQSQRNRMARQPHQDLWRGQGKPAG